MSDNLRLHPLALLGGKNAVDAWPLVSIGIFHWLFIAVAPKWKHTAKLSLVFPFLYGALYSLTVFSLIFFPEKGFEANPDGNFESLQGIIALFDDPTNLFAGWVHFMCFDALVGRWIVLDSQERRASILVHILMVVPCLCVVIIAGPLGWLLYLGLSQILLDPRAPTNDIKNKQK